MRPSTLRKILRRRGSVLILVVALLVLLALVGTAYLTTTRFDRSAAVQNVVNTQKDFVELAAINVVQANVLSDVVDPSAINEGAGTTVRPPSNIFTQLSYNGFDAPLSDFFLADRVPQLQWTHALSGGGTLPRPVWRSITWPGFTTAEIGAGWRFETPDNNRLVRPATLLNHSPAIGPIDLVRPYTVGVKYKKGEVVMVPGAAAGSYDCYIRTAGSPGSTSTLAETPRGGLPFFPLVAPVLWEKCDPKQYFSFAPTTVEIAGKTYPAFYMFNNYVAADWATYSPTGNIAPYATGPFLAGDADGDGIADSGLRKIPLGQLNGLTYYIAVRIVDHNSALNLNTAWAADKEFDRGNIPANAAFWGSNVSYNYGFFPSNIGLREAFFSWNQPNLMGEPSEIYGTTAPTAYNGVGLADAARLVEITRHNLYRFGHPDSNGALDLGLGPAANDGVGSAGTISAGWTFRTQGEALFTQLARRADNPGIGDNNPINNVFDASDRLMRWLDVANDGAAIAFRGSTVVNVDVPPGDLDRRFAAAVRIPAFSNPDNPNGAMDSLYYSADNIRDVNDTATGGMYNKRSYAITISNTNTGTNSAVDRWFDANFNYNRYFDNTRFTRDAVGSAFFRSIRPLVVTSNPVSNVVGPRNADAGQVTVPEQVTDLLPSGAVSTTYGFSFAGGAIELVQTGSLAGSGTALIGTGFNATQNSVGYAIGTLSPMRSYRNPGTGSAAALTATTAKVSANTAEFGDLWRAYWSVMAEDWGSVITPAAGSVQFALSGTAFDREIDAYQAQLGTNVMLMNPYWGSRFSTSNLDRNNFRPAATNTSIAANGTVVPTPLTQFPSPKTPPDIAQYVATLAPGAEVEYNPMRMFRSPIRSYVLTGTGPGAQATDFFTTGITYLRPDQVVLLRSALAAVNTEDLRDTDFKVTRRSIKLKYSGTVHDLGGGNSDLVATINGYEPQPFITEVYVNTDTAQVLAGAGAPNPAGYIAIELHNPYPFPIDIRKCKIGCINRFDSTLASYPGIYVEDMEAKPAADQILLSGATSNLQPAVGVGADWMPPTTIPANGYLVLENYDGSPLAGGGNPNTAQHRPDAAGLVALSVAGNGTGYINAALAGRRTNFAYVANLHRVLNREMVLLRPVDVVNPAHTAYSAAPNGVRNGFALQRMDSVVLGPVLDENTGVRVLIYDDPDCDPAAGPINDATLIRTRAADMVPLDSFDFTGLLPSTMLTPDPVATSIAYAPGQARAWHYVRANESIQIAGGFPGKTAWSFVYPGRYDATKTTAAIGSPAIALPRHQGTQDSNFWAEAGGVDPWQASAGQNPPFPGIQLGFPDSQASYRYEFLAGQFQRGEFTLPLLNRGSVPLGIAGVDLGTGFYPAVESVPAALFPISRVFPHSLPFGGLARNGDLLEVPFIGAYRLQLASHIGSDSFQPALGTTAQLRDVVVELNSITMDAAMAEDTDVADDPIVGPDVNPNIADVGFQSREQIGRFVPLRKTWLPNNANSTAGNDTTSATAGTEPFEYAGSAPFSPIVAANLVYYDDMSPNVLRGIVTTPSDPYAYTSLNRYRWAADLFDFVSVQSPSDDYQPNAVPDALRPDNFVIEPQAVQNRIGSAANSAGEVNIPLQGLVNLNTAPVSVLAMIPWVPELILGTAPDQFTFIADPANFALGQVARVPDGVADNLQMARAIVRYRSGFASANPALLALPPSDRGDNVASYGNFRSQPFESIWDLYRVPEFRNLQALLLRPDLVPNNSARIYLDDRVGDISPMPFEVGGATPPGVYIGRFFGVGDRFRSLNRRGDFVYYECITSHKATGGTFGDPTIWREDPPATAIGLSRPRFDFKEQSLMLTRVSNLLTTRSDMFTVYLLIEGWENAGTDKATLRTTNRAAFFLDRSQTTPGKIELKAPIPIPTE